MLNEANFLSGNIFTVLGSFFSEIGPTEVLDIFVIAFLIYTGLVILRRTRSFLIFNGILVSFGVYLMARFFNLYLTTLFFRFFFAFFIVILAIIFQKELRSFFEWVSISARTRYRNLIGKKSGMVSETVADVIIKAVAYFAHHKIGSLMVLPGKQPIGGLTEGGYELNGRLSLPLILSIFDTSTPGHDGAIIIENELIKKFGAHLPLAERFVKFGDLGTRHRAALGLSEQSDALVIATSEEKGTISVAHQGDLNVLSGGAELKEKLDDFFSAKVGVSFAGKKKWYRWFLEDTRGKILALAMAVLLWLVFVPRSGIINKQFAVPIEFRFLKQDLKVDYLESKEINLTLSGKTQDFALLDAQTLKVVMNASSFEEGWYRIVLYEKDISKPAFISVIDFSPDAVRFHINKINKTPEAAPAEAVQ